MYKTMQEMKDRHELITLELEFIKQQKDSSEKEIRLKELEEEKRLIGNAIADRSWKDHEYERRRNIYKYIKENVSPFADQVKLKVKVLDHDAPYPLHFDIMFYNPAGDTRYWCNEFISYFNDYLLDVTAPSQNIDKDREKRGERWDRIV